jgi:hypothetical protein
MKTQLLATNAFSGLTDVTGIATVTAAVVGTTSTPTPTMTVSKTVVVQSVGFPTVFTIPSTGVPAKSQANDTNANFTASFVAYGVGACCGSWSSDTYTFTPNTGMSLNASSGRRGSYVAFTTTIQTCSGVCTGSYASAAAANALQSAIADVATLASNMATASSSAAIPGAVIITASSVAPQTATAITTSVTTDAVSTPTSHDNTNDLAIGLCVGLGGSIVIILAIYFIPVFPPVASDTSIQMKEEGDIEMKQSC